MKPVKFRFIVGNDGGEKRDDAETESGGAQRGGEALALGREIDAEGRW